MQAARLYEERFHKRYFTEHRIFKSLHQQLRDTDNFSGNRMATGRPGQIRAENDEEVVQLFCENLRTSIRAAEIY